MKLLGQMAGRGGSDYYAAGTYKISDGTLLKPIYGIEWAGADTTISGIKDSDGIIQDANFNWIDNAVAMTTDFGLMTFGCDIYEITCSAAIKIWYIS
jgi:hypothetical protein